MSRAVNSRTTGVENRWALTLSLAVGRAALAAVPLRGAGISISRMILPHRFPAQWAFRPDCVQILELLDRPRDGLPARRRGPARPIVADPPQARYHPPDDR
jgi:hypothetical protein